MIIDVYSLKEKLSFSKISYLKVRTTQGELVILNDHAPMICDLETESILELRELDGKKNQIPTENGGFLKVSREKETRIRVLLS